MRKKCRKNVEQMQCRLSVRFYYKFSEQEIIQYYQDIMFCQPDLPMFIYKFSKVFQEFSLTEEILAKIEAE